MTLTQDEHKVIELAGEIYNIMVTDIIGFDASRSGDIEELAFHVHAIQRMVGSQAAARAYPSKFRLLGEQVKLL